MIVVRQTIIINVSKAAALRALTRRFRDEICGQLGIQKPRMYHKLEDVGGSLSRRERERELTTQVTETDFESIADFDDARRRMLSLPAYQEWLQDWDRDCGPFIQTASIEVFDLVE